MVGFLFVLIVLGALAYFLETYVPMAPIFRVGIRLVIALIVIGYLLQLLGLAWPASPLRFGKN
jgi:hypothetical protein